ncbi:hypothetical protein E0L36_14775 [Streptomyces sp. AJS327]|nr:hypothetical protein [Streptomyces sp. AJS327]
MCRREHRYTAPSYRCGCGTPVPLPLLRGEPPTRVEHRTWAGSWVRVRCGACGVLDEWPQPELGCGCGAVLRLPVDPVRAESGTDGARAGQVSPPSPEDPDAAPPDASGRDGVAGPGGVDGPNSADSGASSVAAGTPSPSREGRPGTPEGTGTSGDVGSPGTPGREVPASHRESGPYRRPPTVGPRPAFQPVTIRTAHDARHAAAHYLRWLGFREVRVTDRRPSSGLDLRGPRVVGHVDPTTSPVEARDVETLWLNGLNESRTAVCFSLAGYTAESRHRAEGLGLPLFVLDLTGTPQPVNTPANRLLRAAP